ncbi:MAG: hypothetical protein P8Z79_17005, partial [Sedimentisphaerales bacterium]
MKSPYLKDSRLADIIGAIQVMGVYPWASRKAEDWLKSLGKPLSASDWASIFKQHPEMFRLTSNGWVSLRWRHGYFRTFDPKWGRDLTESEQTSLTPEQQENLTHKPLTSDQIGVLINTGLNLHARAIAHTRDKNFQAFFLPIKYPITKV